MIDKCTVLARFQGKAVVLGTEIDGNTTWVRWVLSRSWFKCTYDELEGI